MTGVLTVWSRDVSEQHGRKQAWFRHQATSWLHRLGLYSDLQSFDASRVLRLVFVCAGNVCRSRYAEARARALGMEAGSFGLSADGSSPPDAVAVVAARRRGLELSPRASRRARDVRPTAGDLLVAMEPHQARALRRAHPRAQVTLLGLWCRSPRPVLADPYGLSDAYFDTCFGVIDEAVAALVQTVERRRAGV
ncbi:MAG: arsenate reductase/protein-tyrosine-phosphatase family protein [Myxococcaceae bacterium]